MMLAGFLDVFSIIVGVVVTLTGMALALLGGIAIAEKAVKRGTGSLLFGLVLIGLGLWLIGAFG